ncbi:hypothetical protein A6S26_10835 [Nostoc sp. ATCC 43529]|nr:hypothetical protein A6S26_10835 [Nostoc sp. ATCC 43529]
MFCLRLLGRLLFSYYICNTKITWCQGDTTNFLAYETASSMNLQKVVIITIASQGIGGGYES